MQIYDIRLKNYRRFEEARICFHPNFTVMIGENGKGKTTVLDAIALMLGTYLQGSRIPTGRGAIRKDDGRLAQYEKEGQVFLEPQEDVFLEASAKLRDSFCSWKRVTGDRGRQAKDLIRHGQEDRKLISKGEDVDLPLLVYYGAGRLWDIHRDVSVETPSSQLDAYRYCLDPKSDQKAFESWFQKLTLSELQKKKEIPAMDCVRDTVLSCIPGATEFYHDFDYGQVMIKLDGEGYVPFNMLSDGYRNMVAMVADIAHRASKLNPHLGMHAAKDTAGVVLIDEIDLHLHPRWQREVVRNLQQAFCNLQFIATTHSPFIIQSLDPGELVDLSELPEDSPNLGVGNNVGACARPGPADDYSNKSIEDIVEEVMGVGVPQRSQRYQQMYDAAKEYYLLLERSKDASEKEKNEIKEKLDALSAPFSDNVAYHAFLEMERLQAGLGSSRSRGEDK